MLNNRFDPPPEKVKHTKLKGRKVLAPYRKENTL